MKQYLLPILILLFPSSVMAAGAADNYKVISVRIDKTGMGIVEFNHPLSGAPATCINGYPRHLSFNANTDPGKAIMSLALSAQATGKSVIAYGTGTCDEYGGAVESWAWGLVVG